MLLFSHQFSILEKELQQVREEKIILDKKAQEYHAELELEQLSHANSLANLQKAGALMNINGGHIKNGSAEGGLPIGLRMKKILEDDEIEYNEEEVFHNEQAQEIAKLKKVIEDMTFELDKEKALRLQEEEKVKKAEKEIEVLKKQNGTKEGTANPAKGGALLGGNTDGGDTTNSLQKKMESAFLKQIKELELKLDAANYAAATGQRFDDFDHY